MAESSTILQRNLTALRRNERELADRLSEAPPASLAWSEAKTGELTASIDHESHLLALASRYDPQAEAAKLIAGIDHLKTACVTALGFGLGYHLAALAREMGDESLLIVYEPDAALLRAVLERIDHTAWFGRRKLMILDDGITRANLVGRLSNFSGLVTQGLTFLEHPPSRKRYGEAFSQFAKMATEAVAFCRTSVATALVNSARTCQNLACNLDIYVAGETVNELHNAAQGYPAVCVAAGPSLVKNVHLLKQPGVREKVVVIAVQTALKPLLDRGMRPDFVTALDYSAICRRFYENLPPLDDVTLVVEPKGHPAIIESFPGPIRVTRSEFNDHFLGPLARPIVPMPSGATVAHLSFYLAQHLGCDPIIFIGQDLGFSDGLYYAPGTAVHQVWSSELNPFNTIEMMEWRRIVRMRGHLQRATDIHDRPIFSDEQMLTYLKQFERDFATSTQRIIDATEGGMPKEGTQRMTLAEALDQYAIAPVPELPMPSRELDADRLAQLVDLLDQRLDEMRDLRKTTQQSIPILKQMQKYQRDKTKMNKLFAQLQKNQWHAEHDLRFVFNTVSTLNTIGSFRRHRTDREISHIRGDALGRQMQQLDRDIENLQWLVQACEESITMFSEARQRARNSLKKARAQDTAVEHSMAAVA